MNTMMLSFILVAVNAFNLIPNMNISFPKILAPCDNINYQLNQTISSVCSSLQDNGYQVFVSPYNSSGTICQSSIMPYMVFGMMTLMVDGLTHITIKQDILHLPKTLYNVVYHEILHSIGLDHSIKAGLMNYSVKVSYDWLGRLQPIDYSHFLYPSIDDLDGLNST
jgi:hypothetical protein